MIQKFCKKPVEVEAVQWDGTEEGSAPVIDWITANGGTAAFDRIPVAASRYNREFDLRIYIDTLEGPITASPADWIIRGVQGEFYPCKPDIFEATYEAVEPDESIGIASAELRCPSCSERLQIAEYAASQMAEWSGNCPGCGSYLALKVRRS